MNEKLEILNKIKQYDTIIILRHIRPDGDCLGSSLGLREILRASFPNKKIYSLGEDESDYLSFLGAEDPKLDPEAYKDALVIVLDTATSERIDNQLFGSAKEIIKIDHHLRVEDYGATNYVREDLPATSAIIMDLVLTFKDELKFNQQAAKYLYVGLVTDTGRFKYHGVGPEVMRMAAAMLEQNIDLDDIYAHLYIQDPKPLKLQGYILNHFKTTEHGVSYVFLSRSLQKRFGVSTEEASALVNMLDSIRGHLIWIFFVAGKEKIRVRIRSRFVGVNELAAKYHGGGHRQASGASLSHRSEIKKMLKEADLLLLEYKTAHPEAF